MYVQKIKMRTIAIFVVIAILNTSCETLKNVGATFFGTGAYVAVAPDDSAPRTEIAKSAASKESSSVINSNSSKSKQTAQITSRNYKTPASYDEAYSWRTGKAEQKMTQLKNNKNIDAIRKSNVFDYIARVVQEINTSAESNFEKAKMAHDITALVLKYDAANFWKGTVPPQDFISVLESGIAVCEGYANTFKKFCDELKLPCQVVHGYARGVGTTLIDEKNVTDSNHAWNLVQISDAWYLVDCTWDSGFMQGRSAKQEYTTDWLFAKPEHFIYTHLPERQNHQLMSLPLSATQFSALPELRPNFFNAVTDLKTDLAKINNCDGQFEIGFDLRDGYEVSFTIQNIAASSRISNCNFIKKDGKRTIAMFSFPSVGKYNVQIFSKLASAQTSKFCGEFIVDATTASTVYYPTMFANYGKDLAIVSPIEISLKRGTIQKFNVTSNKKFVFVLIGNSYTALSSDGKGNFSGEVMIPKNAKEISLAATDNERGRFSISATYSVF